jgi:glutathione S-transferase
MIALYHNAASTCSQKVRIALAEKGLDYESRDVDLIGGGQHDPEYVKLNPSHVVPTLVHDGGTYIESTLINEYLDDAFPASPLRPADAAGLHAMRLWTKRIDELHPSAGIVTYGIGTRSMLAQRSAEEIEAHLAEIPDLARRAQRRSVIEHGVHSPEVRGAIAAFERVLDAMQADLADRPWLAGDAFTQADAAALPYVLRLDHLSMTPLVEARPRVADWYARVQARKSFEVAITAILPAFIVEVFRANSAAVWDEVRALSSLA